MEKDKPSDLEKIADVMAHRYPKFDSVVGLRNYLKGDFDNFSFVPYEAKMTKTALSAILDETLKSPQRIIQSEETSYAAVTVLSGELERNPRNVVAGFLPTSVEEEELRQFGVSTRKPVQINVGRTMPYLWPLDTNLSGLQQKDMDSYRRIVAKRIRDAVKEKGIGFGILVGSYLGMGTDDVLKLFADDNFKKDLTGKGWQKIPSKSRDGDASAISSVKKNIDEGTQKGYKESLQTLNGRGWLPSDPKILKLHYGIQIVSETVTPCVHLVSASEAAVIAAAEVFKPYDLKMVLPHLQKQYQSYVTSEVKSAHIVSQKPYPKWQYQG